MEISTYQKRDILFLKYTVSWILKSYYQALLFHAFLNKYNGKKKKQEFYQSLYRHEYIINFWPMRSKEGLLGLFLFSDNKRENHVMIHFHCPSFCPVSSL